MNSVRKPPSVRSRPFRSSLVPKTCSCERNGQELSAASIRSLDRENTFAAHLVKEDLVATFDVQIGDEDGPPCIRDDFASPHPEPSGVEMLESLVLLGEDVEFFHERFKVWVRIAAVSQRMVSVGTVHF